MQITSEMRLWEWAKRNSWSGARDRLQHLEPTEIDQIEQFLEDAGFDEWNETALNDFFWFEEDTWLDWIGLDQKEFDKRWKEEPIWK